MRKHKHHTEEPMVEGSQPSETQQPEAGPMAETPESKATRLEQELEQKDAQFREMNDKYLRALADFDNFRKRARQDMDDTRRNAAAAVMEEILPVLDNFERALQAAEESKHLDKLLEGVHMIRRQMQDILERRGVAPIEAVGQPFDPNYHEAVARIETTEHPEGTVVHEVEKGYTFGDRVLRPTKVAVAAVPSEQEQGQASPEPDTEIPL